MVTVAPATTALVGSDTVPVISAVDVCARARAANRNKDTESPTNQTRRNIGGSCTKNRLHLQAANNAQIIAVPHRPLPDAHAVGQGIAVGQLNLFDNLTAVRVVLEKCVQVRVRAPQVFALPADSVRAVSRRVELLLDDPVLRIEAIDGPRRRSEERRVGKECRL